MTKKLIAVFMALILSFAFMTTVIASEEATDVIEENVSGEDVSEITTVLPIEKESVDDEATTAVVIESTTAAPATTEAAEEDAGLNLDIDINDILSSDIMQEIMQNESVIDLTSIVLDLVVKLNADSLKEMGKTEAEKFVQSTVDTIASSIMLLVGNKDLIITYDPIKVMGNLFDLDTEALETKPSEDATKHPDAIELGFGDVDGDGRVTAADARRIIRRAAKLITFTMQEEARADVDKDGKITAEDARKVLRVTSKLESF